MVERKVNGCVQIQSAWVGTQLDESVLRAKNCLDFVEIDAEKVNIDLIRSNLEVSPNGVLTLYDYLRKKGILEIV